MEENCALLDIGFMFDAAHEKSTKLFTFNKSISVDLCYIEQEPGALQSGHYVWPAAPALCNYLINFWEDICHSSDNVVELGAGCGLTGLVVAQLLQQNGKVLFTDHDPGVLKTIMHNVTLQKKENLATCLTECLRWGENGADDIKRLRTLVDGDVSLIVGSDVIYAKEVVELLFWTVNAILPKNECGVFIMCSSFQYDTDTEHEISLACDLYGFSRKTVVERNEESIICIQQFSRNNY